MLNLQAVRDAAVVHEPFHFLIAENVLPSDATLGRDFPNISTTGSFPLSELTYGPAFKQLVSEMTGDSFRDVLSKQLGVSLSSYVPIVTVRGRIGKRDGGIHTDAKWKIATVLLYLNEKWETGGGRLRLLRDQNIDHTIREIPPKWGTLLAFVRSDCSWHGHLPAEGERRVVQLNWVTSQEKADAELNRHRRSGWIKRLFGKSY